MKIFTLNYDSDPEQITNRGWKNENEKSFVSYINVAFSCRGLNLTWLRPETELRFGHHLQSF